MASRKRKNIIPLNIVRSSDPGSKRTCVATKEIVTVSLSSHATQHAKASTGSDHSHLTLDEATFDDTGVGSIGGYDSDTDLVLHEQPAKRQAKQSQKWEECIPMAFAAFVEESVMKQNVKCQCCDEEAVVRCQQCGPHVFYCLQCGVNVHSNCNYHHHPEVWKDHECAFYQLELPVPSLQTHVCERNQHTRAVTCFHIDGIPRKMNILFCHCEPDVVTLTRLNYWPATPSRPSIAFSFSLLDWLQALLLECQVPVQDFCSALKYIITTKYNKMPCNIYPVLIEAFEEYRALKERVYLLEGICDVKQEDVVCPACPKDEGTKVTIAIDANFGLCRKKSSGQSYYSPRIQNSMFVNQPGVDHYVDNYSVKAKTSNACNNFLAGHMLRSKSRYAALDETAVMGAACRHEHPVPCFLSLRHGERIAYSVYMCEVLREQHPKQKIQLMYDIACSLEKHLKIKYNPRNILGFGMSDGEVCERLWSYLRRFAAMTKEMHPSHRVNILNDALHHYGQKSAKNLGTLLPKRLLHAEDVKRKSAEQLQELLTSNSSTGDTG